MSYHSKKGFGLLNFVLGFALSTLLAPTSHADSSICLSPNSFVKTQSSHDRFYICSHANEDQFCSQPSGQNCRSAQIEDGISYLANKKNILGKKAPLNSDDLKGTRISDPLKILAAYLSAMDFKGKIMMGQEMTFQTGQYPSLQFSRQSLNTKCMTTIVQTAYRTQFYFSDFSFVVDSHIQNCNNLRDGIKQLIAQQDKVISTLKRFHSPLHSVFLTNRSRFVHKELGKMGLHVNVNRDGEMERRLIENDISSLIENEDSSTDSAILSFNP